jgi:hypothetical protein
MTLTQVRPGYNALTRRFFEHPLNVGELRGLGVGSGAAGSPSQGTWVRFHIQILRGAITAARFNAFGCPHVIAVASWLTESAVGSAAGPPGAPGLPEPVSALQQRFEVPAEKRGRLLLVEDAWIAAIQAAVTKSGPGLE